MEDRLLQRLLRMDINRVRGVYIARVRAENDRRDEAREWLRSQGYEEVTPGLGEIIDAGDAEYLADGRVLIHAQGKKWAINAEQYHAQIQAHQETMAAAQHAAEQPSVQDKEALAEATCPQVMDGHVCGGSLQQSGVCPSCALGRAGYRFRYSCDSCGYDVVAREPMV